MGTLALAVSIVLYYFSVAVCDLQIHFRIGVLANPCVFIIPIRRTSRANFATPTCRQAAMQTQTIVCKISENWRQQRSSALVKMQQQKSNTPLLPPASRVAFMLQCSAIKLQTQHSYRGLPTSGRAKTGVTDCRVSTQKSQHLKFLLSSNFTCTQNIQPKFQNPTTSHSCTIKF